MQCMQAILFRRRITTDDSDDVKMMSPPCQSLSGMGSTQCTSCPHSVLTLPLVLASTCTVNNYTFIIIDTVAVM